MKLINMALLVGLSAALASPAMAAVKNSSGESARDAAMAACNAQAQKRFGGMYYNFDQNRSYVYGDCMHAHGLAE
jgi:type II secretory pathway pseudopilin PulG